MLRCAQQPQNLGDLVLVAGQQHRVRRILDSGILAAQQVEGGLAAGAQQPGAVVDAAVLGRRRWRPARRGRRATAPTAAACTWSGSQLGDAGNRRPRAPVRAASRIPRRAAWPRPGRPMHSTSWGVDPCVTVLHMLSISNDTSPDVGDRILDAAASCVLAFGVDRVTLAEIARRAGVSRPTVYRRWPDTQALLAALLTARIVGVLRDVPTAAAAAKRWSSGSSAVAERLRHDELVDVGAAFRARAGHGVHRRAARHQPADPDRRGGRRAASRPGATAACAPATRASSPPCAC